MTKVKDLMTPEVVTADLPGTREDIIEILQSGDISSIPVVKDGKYRGLLSREDLIQNPDEDQLAMLMREVATISPDATVKECAKLMFEEDERRLPVVTDSTVEGIITLTDMIKHIAEMDNDDNIGDYVEEGVLTVWQETPVNVAVQTIFLADATAACVID
ncbi:MAG: CBS domain-containing protein, partial [Halobacteria archaeon]|nr:CBS domain-containing protein [Halobacteria archaeon]